MTPTRQILFILPLLVAPLAFSVSLGGEREGTRTRTPPAPAAMRGPKAAAAPSLEREVAPASRRSRLARENPTLETARPVAIPAEERTESLVGLSGTNGDTGGEPAGFAPIMDRSRTEQMASLASTPASLDDYGQAQE